MRGGDQLCVVGFGQAAAFALAAAVDADPVGEPAAACRAWSRPARLPIPARSPSRTPRRQGCDRDGAQVRAFVGRRACPASSSKHKYAPPAPQADADAHPGLSIPVSVITDCRH